jgi:hypothetical protein
MIKKLSKILNAPIAMAVKNASVKVAATFSNHDFLLNSPMIKSREVLAIKGPLKLPLSDNKAGMINIKRIKLSNGIIRSESIIPAKISPIIDTISEGNVCLTILSLSFLASIYHHQNQKILKNHRCSFFLNSLRILII